MRKHIMLSSKQVLLFTALLSIDIEMSYHQDGRKQRLWVGFDKRSKEVYVSTETSHRPRVISPEAFLSTFSAGVWNLNLSDVLDVAPEYLSVFSSRI